MIIEGLFHEGARKGYDSHKHTMQEDTSNYTSKNIFFLWSNLMVIHGLWPLSDDTPFLKGRIIFTVVQLTLSIISNLVKFRIRCGNPDENIDAILLMVVNILTISKCLILYGHRDKLAYVINVAVEDWNVIENQEYKRMMVERANSSNTITKLYYAAGMFCTIAYIIRISTMDPNYVINENSENELLILHPAYLLPGGCVFNDMGDSMYYFVVINQTIQLSLVVAIVGVDAFYIAITAHLCEQCEILKLALKEFGNSPKLIVESHRHLKYLITRHQHLMIQASKLEAVWNKVIFMQMFLSLVLISMTGFNFLSSLNTGDIMGLTKCFGIMQLLLLQSYLYTFPAEELKNQAEGLLCSLYFSEWCNMSTNLKKDMAFIMMRMSLPPYYTAGKFFYMTRESYMIVIKTAVSYLSVLRIMIG